MVGLEICVDSAASAAAAEEGGASRLELCSNLIDGGTTPSIGQVRTLLRATSLPVHVMVRPRGADFLYSSEEIDTMVEDIRAIRDAGAAGVVLGVLSSDGSVDEQLLRRLVSEAAPLPVTFHRAIDVSSDLLEALEACVRCGVRRILSSGGAPSAVDGAPMLRRLVEAAAGRLTVAAAGGLTEENAAELAISTGADELHGSLRGVRRSAMAYRPAVAVPMGGEKRNGVETEFELRVVERARVTAVVEALSSSAAAAS